MRCVDEKNVENRACNLMMYLVLNHHGEKAMLKNPKNMNPKCQKRAERAYQENSGPGRGQGQERVVIDDLELITSFDSFQDELDNPLL